MGGWCILTWIDILPWMGVLPWMGHLLWREVRIIRKYSRFNLGKIALNLTVELLQNCY